MINLILTLALAQPCGMPMKPRTHKHHLSTPAQSCVTPPVPMCFREPEPEPDILPIAAPLIYYTPASDTPTAGDSPEQPPNDFGLVAYGGIVPGNIEPLPPVVVYLPPTGPRPTQPARAPEISGAAAAGALTLLLGFCAILGGRPRE